MKIRSFYRRKVRLLAVLMMAGALAACSSSPEEKSAKFLAEGKKFLEQKDANRAMLQFRNAAQVTPNNPEAYYQLGLAYLAAGDIPQGVKALRKALDVDQKHAAAQLKLAQLMASTNDPEILKDAQKRLEGLLQSDPGGADALHAMALTEFKLGNAGGGMEHLQRAMASAPQELQVAVTLAQARLALGDAKGAEDSLKKLAEAAPGRAEVHTTLAEFYAARNRMGEVEVELRKALAINPKDGRALSALGAAHWVQGKKQEAEQVFKQLGAFEEYKSIYGAFLVQEGRGEEAIKEFERLFKANPDDRGIRTSLVMAYHRGGKTSEAKKVLGDVLKRNGNDLDALLQRGELYLAARDFSAAENDLNRVMNLKPDSPQVHYVVAKLNQARGNALTYRQHLDEALKLNPYLFTVRAEAANSLISTGNAQAALDLLDAAPGEQKGSVAHLTERNWALWAAGKMPEMRAGIDRAMKVAKTGDLLLQDGLWKLRSGQTTAARASIEEALKMNPTDVRALATLNQSFGAGEASAGIRKLKEYAASTPNSAPVQEFLGMVLASTGDNAGARKAFETSAAADPTSVSAEMKLVQVDVQDQKFGDARNRLNKLVAAGKSSPMVELWLGNLEVVAGNQDAALALFRKVVAAEPRNAQALNNLAFLLSEHAKLPDEALKYAETAVELTPGNATYADTLGWILYQKGLYANSLRYLEIASAVPNSAVAKYHLAMAYAKAGQPTKGKATLEAALKLDPRRREARDAQAVVLKSN